MVKVAAAESRSRRTRAGYTNEDFRSNQQYDLIVETGGNRALSDLRRVLSKNGIPVLVGGEGGNRVLGGTDKWIHALLPSPFLQQKLRPLSTRAEPYGPSVREEARGGGQAHPIIDRTFALSEVPDACRDLEKGRGPGKVVITV